MYQKINTKTAEITPIATKEELRTEIWAAIERLAPELANDMGTMHEVSEAEWAINAGDEWQMGDIDGNLDDYKFMLTPMAKIEELLKSFRADIAEIDELNDRDEISNTECHKREDALIKKYASQLV